MIKKILSFLLLGCLIALPAYGASNGSCYDADTVFLLHMDGTDASTTFTDSSNSAHTVTVAGNSQIDTAQSEFGGASGLFDGTGDSLSIADSANWNFGSGDLTIDLWVRFNSVNAPNFYSQYVDNNNRFAFRLNGAGNLQFFIISGGTTLANYATATPPGFTTATWYHLALVRSGTSVFIFVNGVSQTLTVSTAISTNSVPDLAAVLHIGSTDGAVNDFNGWIDEYRVIKGTAVWTSNFTSPTSAYTQCSVGQRIHIID